MKSIFAIISLAALAAGCSPVITAGAREAGRVPYDPTLVSKDIAFHEGRVAVDPGGALGFSFLSAAYLKRSKEIDSTLDAQKSEMAARRSLQLRRNGNVAAANHLVQALLQQHRFHDALVAARDANKIVLEYGPSLQLEAECLFELGRYHEAKEIFYDHIALMSDAPGQVLAARFLQLEGRDGEALQLLKTARDSMVKNVAMPCETTAWFIVRYGEALAAMGRDSLAEEEYRQALGLYPRNHKAYAGLTRLAAGRGDWRAVIENGEKSNSIAKMIDITGLVGDAYSELGDKAKAHAAYAEVRQVAGRPSAGSGSIHDFASAVVAHGHTLDRQYAMFCADHLVDLDGAYAAALRDIQVRRDIYAFDTIGWVCFKRGEQKEAELAIGKTLAYGTKDARLFFHAGEIYQKAGRRDLAKTYLSEALAKDPTFNALQAAEARVELGKASQ